MCHTYNITQHIILLLLIVSIFNLIELLPTLSSSSSRRQCHHSPCHLPQLTDYQCLCVCATGLDSGMTRIYMYTA